MTGNGGNFWIVNTVTNNFYNNVVGLYGVPLKDTYWFWAQYVPLDSLLATTGKTVRILFQMGDANSNWEGVYLDGLTGGYKTNQMLKPISLSNAGWNRATPEIAGTTSSFTGFYDY